MRKLALVWLVVLFSAVAFAQQQTTPTPTVMPGQTAYPAGYTGQLTPTPSPTDIVPTSKATPVPTNKPKFGAGQ